MTAFETSIRFEGIPRRQRIESPGAVYHIISRRNYRKELFVGGGAGEAFERSLFEAAERSGWTVGIAKRLRKETTAGNPWIARRLAMGHPHYVSNLVNG